MPELAQWEQLASAVSTGMVPTDQKGLGAQALEGTSSSTGPWGEEDVLDRQGWKLHNAENVPNAS